MPKLNVAVLGACGKGGFAWIAQSIILELHNHPYFQVVAGITERASLKGEKLGRGLLKWYEEEPLPPEISNLSLLPPDGDLLRENKNVDLVISALPPQLSRKLDIRLASSGMPVISESPGLRAEPDIPLITPEINVDHLEIIDLQKRRRGWDRGFIIANPGCTYTILALALKPILNKVGIKGAVITTMQAISGAGPDAIPGMGIIDNVIPFIPQEEDKLALELPKILGEISGDRVIPAEIALSATCCRVPVLDGHTMVVSLDCEAPIRREEAINAWQNFTGAPQFMVLPSATDPVLEVVEAEDRPQPRLDRIKGHGRRVTIGRVRVGGALRNGLTFVVVGHNRYRGTFGNTILNAEMLYGKGLLHRN
jgi:aspartate-semialdehyde dehydrogenase